MKKSQISTSILVGLLLLLVGCQSDLTKVGSVEIESSCFLDESDFPSGWVATFGGATSYGAPGQMLPGRALGGGLKGFVHERSGARASQDIFLYNTPEKATREYSHQQPFGSASRITPWRAPAVVFKTRQADQFKTACAEFDTGGQRTSCDDIARYGRYLVLFSSWVSPEYMSDEEFTGVLQSMEKRMLACMSNGVSE